MYTLTQKEFSSLKAALTRAKNSNDPKKLLAAAQAGLARFEEAGYPDAWHRWESAKEDAIFALARGRTTLRVDYNNPFGK